MNCAFSFDGYERDVKSVNNYFRVVCLKCLLNDGGNYSGNRIWKIIFYFVRKLLEKTNATMFHTKKIEPGRSLSFSTVKNNHEIKECCQNTVHTPKGPEAFSLNSVSGLLIALKYVEFLLALAGQ